ncbi:trypsin-like serine protease [Microbacterium sp. YY-01]|uniref:S1 family peptidase n=1 Tax=Microbacterium sp. YY-01 TaxID=3421634 RepID=UPI003D162722
MKNSNRRAVRLFAVGATAALAASGLLLSPATAAEINLQTAPVDGVEYGAFAQELVGENEGINGVGLNGEGEIVVSVTSDELSDETKALLDSYDNLVIDERGPIKALSTDDVVGGAGYLVEQAGLCSFGFSGWTPDGDPAIITAGHCGVEGETVERTVPSTDDAPYFPAQEPAYQYPDVFGVVGTFGFSQWGGPGGTEGEAGDPSSTDIAAIDVTDTSVNLLPEVTDWSTWQSEDLSGSTTVINGVGEVAVGDNIFRSGRSTGQQSGTVLQVDMYINVCEEVTPVPVNCHVVNGFLTDAVSRGGDSGGSFVKDGGIAVGVLSGGDNTTSFATALVNGLNQTPGYTVMVFIDAPVVDTANTVTEGATITGTGKPGHTLVVELNGSETEVEIAADGTWSFPAPGVGDYTYQLTVKDDGYNVSETVEYELTVEQAPLTAPTITSPADGLEVELPQSPDTITGTGFEGATVTVIVDGVEVGTTDVTNGTWSFTLDAPLAEGVHEISAFQTRDDEIGPTSDVVTVTVVPEAVTPEPTPTPEPTDDPNGNGDGGNGDGLPETGMDTSAVISASMLGVGVLAAGVIVLMVSRKRAHAQD